MMPTATAYEFILQMKEAYKTFFMACQALTERQAMMADVCGEWSAKAVVDHLTGWQVQSLPIIQALVDGDKSAFDLDIDAFNQTSVDRRQDLTWQESLKDFELSFNEFLEALNTIPESPFKTEAGLITWVKAMIHEYQVHLTHIHHAQTI